MRIWNKPVLFAMEEKTRANHLVNLIDIAESLSNKILSKAPSKGFHNRSN